MRAVLPLLLLAACGGAEDPRGAAPRSGALAGGAPDVVLLVAPSRAGGDAAWDALRATGTSMSAAFATSDDVDLARAALFGLRLAGADEGDLLARFEAGGYRCRAVDGSSALDDALTRAAAEPELWWVELAEDASGADLARAVAALDARAPGVLVVALALTGDPRAAPLTVARLGVPLVFRLTGRLPAGEVRPQVVSLVDIGPTLLDLCGVEAPPVPDTDGASFARLLQKQPLAWRGEVFARLGAEDGESEAAVLYTSSWRLALQGDGRLLLSFVRDDPERVADDLELAGGLAARAELAQRLAEWMGR
jgi:hypothetical protein